MNNIDNSARKSRWPIFLVFLAIIVAVGSVVYFKSVNEGNPANIPNYKCPRPIVYLKSAKESNPAVVPMVVSPKSEKGQESVALGAAKEYKLADIITAQMNSYNRTWDAVNKELYGQKAPNFTVKGIDGNDIKLSDFAGKEIVLVFWATWCKYCVEEIPSLNLLQKGMSDDVKILAVSDESVDTVKKFIASRKIDYTIATASQGFTSMGQIYTIPASQARPAAMHIGKDGLIKIIYLGSPSLTELKQIIKSK